MKIVNLFLGMNYMSIKSVKFNLLLLPENRVLHPSVFLPAKQLSVLRPLSLKGFYETLRNYRNASRHCTLEHSSDNKTFSWGDQTILNHLLNGKNNLETVLNWTIKLLDFVKSPCCSGFLSAGESISRPKNVPLTFKEQKPQRSIQESLLNTKISRINGQTTLLFCFRSHARTLWGPSFIKKLALQHGVAMRYPSTWSLAAKGLILSPESLLSRLCHESEGSGVENELWDAKILYFSREERM